MKTTLPIRYMGTGQFRQLFFIQLKGLLFCGLLYAYDISVLHLGVHTEIFLRPFKAHNRATRIQSCMFIKCHHYTLLRTPLYYLTSLACNVRIWLLLEISILLLRHFVSVSPFEGLLNCPHQLFKKLFFPFWISIKSRCIAPFCYFKNLIGTATAAATTSSLLFHLDDTIIFILN